MGVLTNTINDINSSKVVCRHSLYFLYCRRALLFFVSTAQLKLLGFEEPNERTFIWTIIRQHVVCPNSTSLIKLSRPLQSRFFGPLKTCGCRVGQFQSAQNMMCHDSFFMPWQLYLLFVFKIRNAMISHVYLLFIYW